MNKKSGIKLENFIVATTAASVCFFISFLRSWAIPVKSIVVANRQSRALGETFTDAYLRTYNESVMELSRKPQDTYEKYLDKMSIIRAKYSKIK